MDNFNLKKYIAEGRLLKENITQFKDYITDMFNSSVDDRDEVKAGYQSDVWEKEEYASDAYENASTFIALSSYLGDIGGKATLEGNPDITVELLRNGDIKWSADVTLAEGKLLKENAPGYDTRKFGESLPTLESVKAAYEDGNAKEDVKETLDDDVWRKLDDLRDEYDDDYVIKSIIKAMSTDDANLYLDAIMQDHGFGDGAGPIDKMGDEDPEQEGMYIDDEEWEREMGRS